MLRAQLSSPFSSGLMQYAMLEAEISMPLTMLMTLSFLFTHAIYQSLFLEWLYRMCLTVFQVLDLAYTGLSDLPEEFVQLSSIRHKLQLLYLNGNQFSHVPQTLAALGKQQFLNLRNWKMCNSSVYFQSVFQNSEDQNI